MASERWREGRLSTRFIAEEYGAAYVPREPDGAMARRFAGVALAIDAGLSRRRDALSGRIRPAQPPAREARSVFLGKTRLDVVVEPQGDALLVHFGPEIAPLRVESAWRPADRSWTGEVDGRPLAFGARAILNGYQLSHAGYAAAARVLTPRQAELAGLMLERAEADTSKVLLCPMPGLVKKINVGVGQAVKAGEPLCLVEAMKMENVLKAERDLTVKTVEAREGDSLAVDAPIMTFV